MCWCCWSVAFGDTLDLSSCLCCWQPKEGCGFSQHTEIKPHNCYSITQDGVIEKNHYYRQQFRSVHQWLRKSACMLKADDAISFLKLVNMLKKKPCLFHQSCLRKIQNSWSNCPSLKPALADFLISFPSLHTAQRRTWEPSKVAFSAFAENWDRSMATCLPQEDSLSELEKQFHSLFRRESLFMQLKSMFPHRVMFNSYRIHILDWATNAWNDL